MNRRLAAIGVATLVALHGRLPAAAETSAPVSILHLMSTSSLVVVGNVDVTSLSGSTAAVRIQVERVLQGATEGAGEIAASWNILGPVPEGQPSGTAHGLVFLSGSQAGWSMAAASSGARLYKAVVPLPAGPLPAEWHYAETAPLVDKVTAELWQAAAASDGTLAADGLLALAPLLAADCSHEAAQPHCLHLAGLSAAEGSACLYLKALRLWAPALLDHIDAHLAQHAADALPFGYLHLLGRIASATQVDRLGTLLQKAPAGSALEGELAHSLGRIHSQAALPLLARLLDSPDRETQYQAVMGFASFANNYSVGRTDGWARKGGASTDATRHHAPSYDRFLADPQFYLGFWKAWYPGHPPTVAVSGGGASCHPLSPLTPCSVPLSAAGADADGDPVYYRWSGCSTSAASTASCKVAVLGPVTGTVTVDDGRGGTSTTSTTVTGVNATPKLRCVRWYPGGVLPEGTDARLEFSVADDDTTDSAACKVQRVYRKCHQTAFHCSGKSGSVDVRIDPGDGTKLCSVDLSWKDRWGAASTVSCSTDTQ